MFKSLKVMIIGIIIVFMSILIIVIGVGIDLAVLSLIGICSLIMGLATVFVSLFIDDDSENDK